MSTFETKPVGQPLTDPSLIAHWGEPATTTSGPVFTVPGGFADDTGFLPPASAWWETPGVPSLLDPHGLPPTNSTVPHASSPDLAEHSASVDMWRQSQAAPTPISPIDLAVQGIGAADKLNTDITINQGDPSARFGMDHVSLVSDALGFGDSVGKFFTGDFTAEDGVRGVVKAVKTAAAATEIATGDAVGTSIMSPADQLADQARLYDPRNWKHVPGWTADALVDMADAYISPVDRLLNWLGGGDPVRMFPDGVPSPAPPASGPPISTNAPMSIDAPQLPMRIEQPGAMPPMPDFTAPKAPVIPPSLPLPLEAMQHPMVIDRSLQLPMVIPPSTPPMPDFTAPQPSVIPPSLPLPLEAAQLPAVIPTTAPTGSPSSPSSSSSPSVDMPSVPDMHLGSALVGGGATGGAIGLGTDLFRRFVLGEDISAGTMAKDTALGAVEGAGSDIAGELLGAGITKAATPMLGAGAQLVGKVAGGGIVEGALAGITSTFSNAGAVERGEVDAAHATANVAVDTGIGLTAGLAGAAAGAGIGAAMGSFVPGLGTTIGAGVGFVGGGLTSLAVSMAAQHSGFADWAKDGLGDALGFAENPLGVAWSGINGGIDGAMNGAMIGGAGGAAMGALGTGLTGAALGFMAGGPIGALLGGAAGAGVGAVGGGLIGAGLGVLPGAAIGTGMGVVDGLRDWLCPTDEQAGDFS